MTEKNWVIPNMYINQYRLRCRLNQIDFPPSICKIAMLNQIYCFKTNDFLF
jgi:hypothetical protein